MTKKVNTFEIFKGALFIFVVPLAIFYLAQWDPISGIDEYGDPKRIGIYFIAIPYWTALFFIHKYRTRAEILQNTILGITQIVHEPSVNQTEFLKTIDSLQWVDRDFYNEIIRHTKKDV